jgi:hypothetical protein
MCRRLVDRQLEHVERADEVGHKGGLGMLVDLTRAPGLLDLAAVHHGDPVGHRKRFFLIVRDVDECRAELALDALELVLHLPSQLDVEGPERLVEQQGRRTVDERPRKRDPLLLPTRAAAAAGARVLRARRSASTLGSAVPGWHEAHPLP